LINFFLLILKILTKSLFM